MYFCKYRRECYLTAFIQDESACGNKQCLFVCVEVFTAQSPQWGHIERGQFT